jgi:hypothetical protein
VEYDFIELLYESSVHSHKVMNLYSRYDGGVLWRVSGVTSFDPKSPFDEVWLVNQFKIPMDWNQDGSDAVCLVQNGRGKILRFIQVSRGLLNLRCFSDLLPSSEILRM